MKKNRKKKEEEEVYFKEPEDLDTCFIIVQLLALPFNMNASFPLKKGEDPVGFAFALQTYSNIDLIDLILTHCYTKNGTSLKLLDPQFKSTIQKIMIGIEVFSKWLFEQQVPDFLARNFKGIDIEKLLRYYQHCIRISIESQVDMDSKEQFTSKIAKFIVEHGIK